MVDRDAGAAAVGAAAAQVVGADGAVPDGEPVGVDSRQPALAEHENGTHHLTAAQAPDLRPQQGGVHPHTAIGHAVDGLAVCVDHGDRLTDRRHVLDRIEPATGRQGLDAGLVAALQLPLAQLCAAAVAGGARGQQRADQLYADAHRTQHQHRDLRCGELDASRYRRLGRLRCTLADLIAPELVLLIAQAQQLRQIAIRWQHRGASSIRGA